MKINQNFLLEFKPQQVVYLNIRNETLAVQLFSMHKMISQNNIYSKELELFKDNDYAYFYSVLENEQFRNENQPRYFKYDSHVQFKPDVWEKTWILYRFKYMEPSFNDECQVQVIGQGQTLTLQPAHANVLEASELISNTEEVRQFQIGLRNQNIQRIGKKINVSNYKKCKMNQVKIHFQARHLHVDNDDNELNAHIEQNCKIFQTEVDPEKEKDEQYQQELKRKEKQVFHLRDQLTISENENFQLREQITHFQNENIQKDLELASLKKQSEILNQTKLKQEKDELQKQIEETKCRMQDELDQSKTKCAEYYKQYMLLTQQLDLTPLQNSSDFHLDQHILGKIKEYQDKIIEIKTLKMEEQYVQDFEYNEEKYLELTKKSSQLYEEVQNILNQIKEDCSKSQISDFQDQSTCYELKINKLQEIVKNEQQNIQDLKESATEIEDKLKKQISENKIYQQKSREKIEKLTQAYESIKGQINEAKEHIFEPFFKNQFEYIEQISKRYQEIAKQQIKEQLQQLLTATNQANINGSNLSEEYELLKEKLNTLQQVIQQQIHEINDTCQLSNLYSLFQNVNKQSYIIGQIEEFKPEQQEDEDEDSIENLRAQRAKMGKILWSLEKLKEVLQLEQNLQTNLNSKSIFITDLYLKLAEEVNQKLMIVIEDVRNKK